jgi:hypothetical protein
MSAYTESEIRKAIKDIKAEFPNGFSYGLVAGHGGLKNGVYQILSPGSKQVTFPDGLKIYEGHENRIIKDVILELASWEIGLEVIDIVPEVEDIPIPTRASRIAKHLKDYKAKGKCFITFELHLNAFNGQAQGREVFTTRGEDFSDIVAQIWWDKSNKVVPDQVKRPDYSNKGPDKEKDFNLIFAIKKAGGNSILIEFFFFDNRKEVDLYCTPVGYAKWAETILRTMLELNRIFKEA